MTLNDIKLKRRQDWMPDASFDLSGNATIHVASLPETSNPYYTPIISQREYAIAKMFDEDRDGKLNSREKAKWIQALKDGFEKVPVWFEGKNDPKYGLRIVQRKGKIMKVDEIHGEEINVNPNKKSTGKTRTQLNELRKQRFMNEAEKRYTIHREKVLEHL